MASASKHDNLSIKHVYALATSIASAHLQFHSTCTPWLGRHLTPHEVTNLYELLTNKVTPEQRSAAPALRIENIRNAMYLGYAPCSSTPLDYFVIFPHLDKDIRCDPSLLQRWHDDVVFPAWQSAWEKMGTLAAKFRRTSMLSSLEACRKESERMRNVELARHASDTFGKSDVSTIDSVQVEGLAFHGEWPIRRRKLSEYDVAVEDVLDRSWRRICQSTHDHQELNDLDDLLLVVVWSGKGADAIDEERLDRSLDRRYIQDGLIRIVYDESDDVKSNA